MLRNREPYLRYYRLLGFVPRNLALYDAALLHRSASVRAADGRLINNERLEFLGDAVLDAIVAELLFSTYRNRGEGFLTDMRSRIVQRPQLNRLAECLNLDQWVVSFANRGGSHNNICGNALEALIGAIYMDRGYGVCRRFVRKRLLEPFVDLERMEEEEINFKSRLIEWCQKHRIELEFRVVKDFLDEKHNPVFVSEVRMNERVVATGSGYSKKASQQEAAKRVLGRLDEILPELERLHAEGSVDVGLDLEDVP